MHPNRGSQRKRELRGAATGVFEKVSPLSAEKYFAAGVQALQAKIGQLVAERCFLRTALGRQAGRSALTR